MIKKTAVFVMITIFLIACSPAISMALMDLDADPTPVVSSGSFICKTWGGTTMDSFKVGGGSLAAASFSRSRGLVVYNLSGSCNKGDTVSLDISGSQWDMSKSMVGLKHNQIIMSIQYLNASGKDISEAQKHDSAPSKSPSLSGSLSGSVPAGTIQVVIRGTFTCTWSSASATASETVGVYVTLAVGEASIPVPTTSETTKPAVTPRPTASPTPSTTPATGWWPWQNNKPTPIPNQDSSIVRFGDLYGEVNVLRAEDWAAGNDDAWVFAELNTPLRHGDRIRTLPRSGAILSFSDMSSFEMKPDSVIVLDIANERESKIGLVAGNVWINLKRMVKDGSMEVEMSQAVAGIKGTILAASVTAAGEEFYLFTSSATVTSKITGKIISLKPGEMALVAKNGEIKVSDFDIEAEAVKLGIPMSDLKADGYGKNTSWLIWILSIVICLIIVIAITLLLRKNRIRSITSQSKNETNISSFGQVNVTSTLRNAYCPNCGNPISNDQRFCQHCGKQI